MGDVDKKELADRTRVALLAQLATNAKARAEAARQDSHDVAQSKAETKVKLSAEKDALANAKSQRHTKEQEAKADK